MEEGKGERYLAPGRQYGNALLGVRHQEEEEGVYHLGLYRLIESFFFVLQSRRDRVNAEIVNVLCPTHF